ncbi:zinc-dependent metalloprotease [Fulvivirga maritima]|uniref:zinc-dependent metalloprotease n=1 Tax=Fulvivirga maritima TaxID=2904247 RepID=UPI001F2A74DE|nr:zinc-dependent metalloprotease [Fulvivirga maritima]UII28194.1 zinc-dependent metalloprotease [Fulvivirga maritima]
MLNVIMFKKLALSIVCFVGIYVFFPLHAQDKKDEEKKVEKDSTDTSGLKSYDELLKDADLQTGLFNIINQKEDYYFEIPDSLFNREFLIVSKISKVPFQLNEAGLNKGMEFENKVIRFEKDTLRNKVWARTYIPMVSSPEDDAITISVKNNFSSSIVEVFETVSYNKRAGSTIIKVNKAFNGGSKSFYDVFNNTGLGSSALSNLSMIKSIKTFPLNVMVKSDLSAAIPDGGTTVPLTITVACNIVLLSEKPMQPRYLDERVGFFSKKHWYFNDEQQAMDEKELITRWRLEPKPEDVDKYLRGELVEPAKPIVFYIDPSTPEKWRSYIIDGVHDWQVAFEQAGFKNAVIAKLPSEEDKDFDLDDVRYSVITYAASPKSNAMGPSVVDPRSGEIIEADIIWWHNVMTSLQSWMRIQTGAIDERARHNVFEDQLMGEAVRFVSSHEVGHTFGLKHNMGASYAFPVDSLRSKTFTDKMGGTAPSIMDYARYNYVAQPEDGVTAITPKIGIYDKYAIQWGYQWFPDEKTEKTFLYQLVNTHSDDPLYTYGEQQDYRNVIDPRSQSEDLGDDAVKASTYGLKNLKRVLAHAIDWTYQENESYYNTGKLYMGVIGQWQLYNNHVMNNVGGVYLNKLTHGDNRNAYEPVPFAMQQKAVKYLNENVFSLPEWLFLDKEILSKTFPLKDSPMGPFEYSPYSTARDLQNYVLYNLFNDQRLLRLLESELIADDKAETYTVQDLFSQVRSHVFKNTLHNKPLNAFERMAQKNYVDVLIIDINKLFEKTNNKSIDDDFISLRESLPCGYSLESSRSVRNINFSSMKRVSEVASLKKGELYTILELLKKKRKKGDDATKMHYLDLINRIEQVLNF